MPRSNAGALKLVLVTDVFAVRISQLSHSRRYAASEPAMSTQSEVLVRGLLRRWPPSSPDEQKTVALPLGRARSRPIGTRSFLTLERSLAAPVGVAHGARGGRRSTNTILACSNNIAEL
jgi:hypothetical protein